MYFRCYPQSKSETNEKVGGAYHDFGIIAREPAICLFMLLRPKGFKACSEAEKYAEFKN